MPAEFSFADHTANGEIHPDYLWVTLGAHDVALTSRAHNSPGLKPGSVRIGDDDNNRDHYGLSVDGLKLFMLLNGYGAGRGFLEIWSDDPEGRIRFHFADFTKEQAKDYVRSALEHVFGELIEGPDAAPIS